MNANNTILYLGILQDKAIQASFGAVMIAHSHLDHILRMTIRSLANVSQQEALDATIYEGSKKLRERINELATRRLGKKSSELIKLQAILTRARRLTEQRNTYVHSLWGQELDGPPVIMNEDDRSWGPVPSAQELEKLANDIEAITNELNIARLEGFLSKALDKEV